MFLSTHVPVRKETSLFHYTLQRSKQKFDWTRDIYIYIFGLTYRPLVHEILLTYLNLTQFHTIHRIRYKLIKFSIGIIRKLMNNHKKLYIQTRQPLKKKSLICNFVCDDHKFC